MRFSKKRNFAVIMDKFVSELEFVQDLVYDLSIYICGLKLIAMLKRQKLNFNRLLSLTID